MRSWNDLPYDLLQLVVQCLPFRDICSLSGVTRRYRAIIVSSYLDEIRDLYFTSRTHISYLFYHRQNFYHIVDALMDRGFSQECVPLICAGYHGLILSPQKFTDNYASRLMKSSLHIRDAVIRRLESHPSFHVSGMKNRFIYANTRNIRTDVELYTSPGFIGWETMIAILDWMKEYECIELMLSMIIRRRREGHLFSLRHMKQHIILLPGEVGIRCYYALGWHRGFMIFLYFSSPTMRKVVRDAMNLWSNTFDQRCILSHAKRLIKKESLAYLISWLKDFPLDERHRFLFGRFMMLTGLEGKFRMYCCYVFEQEFCNSFFCVNKNDS